MKLKRYIAAVSAVLLLFSLFSAAGAPGGTDDPVVTVSYVQNTFIPKVLSYLTAETDTAFSGKVDEAAAKVTAAISAYEKNLTLDAAQLQDRIVYSAYMQMLDDGLFMHAGEYTLVTLTKGQRLVVAQTGAFTVREGSAVIGGGAASSVVNATVGAATATGSTASRHARYIVADEGVISVKALSDNTRIVVAGSYQIVPALQPQYTDMAFLLKNIGVFKGSNLGFELDREPTRLEALILFIRLIGEEQQALDYTGTHPFADVPMWPGDAANKYVAYAYSKGYTNGVSKTQFGTNSIATAEQYLTFVLRALGYKDGTDFTWKEAAAKAGQIGILASGDMEKLLRRGFYRDHVVYISYYSLQASMKSTGMPLINTLVVKGLVSDQAASEAVQAYPRQ